MSKKPAKRKTTNTEVAAARLLAARQAAQLRRARNLQRTIKRLTGEVARAIVHADAARLSLARMLCEDTGWSVLATAEVDRDQEFLENARTRIRSLELKLANLEAEKAGALARI